jgi:hypothetical protein
MSWGQDTVDRFVKNTLPPDVKVMPPDVSFVKDGDSNPELFDSALRIAVMLLNEDGNTLLLDALRKKWPEAVAASLSEVMGQVEREKVRLQGWERQSARLAYA